MMHTERNSTTGSCKAYRSKTIILKEQPPQQWVGFPFFGYFIKTQKWYFRNNSLCLCLSVFGQNNTFNLTKAPTPTQLWTKLSSCSWATLQMRRCNLKCRFMASHVVTHIHTCEHTSLPVSFCPVPRLKLFLLRSRSSVTPTKRLQSGDTYKRVVIQTLMVLWCIPAHKKKHCNLSSEVPFCLFHPYSLV